MKRARSTPLLLLFIACGAAGLAHAAAPSPTAAGDAECRQALEQLHLREEAQRAARQAATGSPADRAAAGIGNALALARRQAAKACLGGASDPPVARQRAQQPLSVTPVAPSADMPAAAQVLPPSALQDLLPAPRPGRPGTARAPSPVAPPAVESRPLSRITSCDVAGCWTSEGQYLMRSGPTLSGPPGVCTSVAGVLNCR